MNFTKEEFVAINLVSQFLASIDGEAAMEEFAPICDFLIAEGLSSEDVEELMKIEMDTETVISVISAIDEEGKQKVSNLLFKVILADSKCTKEEEDHFKAIVNACDLPVPQEEDDDETDDLIPTFLLARSNGLASIYQSESEDWRTLDAELCGLIGAERLEVVRYTNPLNRISQALGLDDSHLVFMVDRNGYAKGLGDNMTGTILYGSGNEILGDIIFALETDSGYKIKGIESRKLMIDTFSFINQIAGNLLRLE